jgi:glucose-6-phosphate 1-epimerase
MLSVGFQPSTMHSPEGANATLYPYGAHLTSWRAADGVERLFTSRLAEFSPGVAIRGGVPIIFPQFAGLGTLPKHGFARTSRWQWQSAPDEPTHHARLRWCDDAVTYSQWPQHFEAEYTVALQAESLKMTLEILNTGAQVFSFTAALHTYLRIKDVEQISVTGLQGLRYRDSAAGGAESCQSEAELYIAGEIDRIYLSAIRPIQVVESGQRTITCSAEGFTDAVIWNPGADKGAALADLEPDGYRRMLCVEAATIGEPVVLEPGAKWSGTQKLALV